MLRDSRGQTESWPEETTGGLNALVEKSTCDSLKPTVLA